jgi:hypothetical protein
MKGVVVYLRGGLGNQMFQYAAGVAIAKKTGLPILLDTVFLNDRLPRPGFTYRTLDLDIFGIEGPLTRISSWTEKISIPGGWMALDLALTKAREILRLTQRVTDESILSPPKPGRSYFVYGRFQNEQCFMDASEEVRNAFRFSREPEPEVKKILDEIKKGPSVSLHVRRGDYLNARNAGQFVAQGEDYYERAVEHILKFSPEAKFYVVSDDLPWCKANLGFLGGRAVFVPDEVKGHKASGHFRIMMSCDHNVIANSSFSWWPAWLNPNPGKVVVAPEQWFRDNSQFVKDPLPASWVSL